MFRSQSRLTRWLLRELRDSRLGHWMGLHSPSLFALGQCWCQRQTKRR